VTPLLPIEGFFDDMKVELKPPFVVRKELSTAGKYPRATNEDTIRMITIEPTVAATGNLCFLGGEDDGGGGGVYDSKT
jgi:hypothetical protein